MLKSTIYEISLQAKFSDVCFKANTHCARATIETYGCHCIVIDDHHADFILGSLVVVYISQPWLLRVVLFLYQQRHFCNDAQIIYSPKIILQARLKPTGNGREQHSNIDYTHTFLGLVGMLTGWAACCFLFDLWVSGVESLHVFCWSRGCGVSVSRSCWGRLLSISSKSRCFCLSLASSCRIISACSYNSKNRYAGLWKCLTDQQPAYLFGKLLQKCKQFDCQCYCNIDI